ncbi:uncharacterized protein FFMR_07011 [Fusarium fujikuroi]|nr:uncharacterized protein FFMR_07011 [Fusarium fujikuroi]
MIPVTHHPIAGGLPVTAQDPFAPRRASDASVDAYLKARRAADLICAWDTTPADVVMQQIRHDSQVERQIGRKPLIPNRGRCHSLLTGHRKDQISHSPSGPSMLQRVPDEILLMIVSCLSDPDDKPSLFAFFALRQVSRRFRCLLQADDFITHPFSREGCCQQCSDGCQDKHTSPICPPGGHHCFDYKSVGEIDKRGPIFEGKWGVGGFGDFIRSYTTCKDCQESREGRIKAGYSTTCKFAPCGSQEYLHCHSCDADHPSSCFSKDRAKLPEGRACIANEGYIRIYEYKTLTRADIELLLPDEVPDYRPVFLTSCDHPEHKVPCSENFDYTDQTPRVFATNPDGLGIMIHILWQGHSGSDRSTLHKSGYIHRHKLNDSLGRIRQNGGSLLLPQRGPNTLPEWNVISEIDCSEVVSSEEDLIKLRGGWGYTNRQRRHNTAALGPERIACGHCRYDKNCIVVNYHRKIPFWNQYSSWASHEWLHAIDRKSYVYNGPAGVPETCDVGTCRNSFVGKEDQVYIMSQVVNFPCAAKSNFMYGDNRCELVVQEKQPCENDGRLLESCEDHDVEEPEEALAPREHRARFSLYGFTRAMLQHWQYGRAGFSSD